MPTYPVKNLKTGEKKETLAIIGDRIFTDILAGNRFGIYTILVKPTNSGR